MIESLETRRLLSAAVATVSPTFQFAAGGGETAPFSPNQITTAYGFNPSFGSVVGNGAGQTIAIVDAFNDPDLTSDVASFNTMYTLPQFNVTGGPTFSILNQNGQSTSLPSNATPGDWDVEESLDVEWAHAMAPMANIILVEANSNAPSDLYSAALQAAKAPGVSVVSMSWGGGETSNELQTDSDFLAPAGHEGITFVASTGDTGEPGDYPAFSPNVVAVGGTSLTINSDGSYGGEIGWNLVQTSQGPEGTGGGISLYESQPSYQANNVNGITTTAQHTPDVSWLADPNTGVVVYDSYYTKNSDHLYQVGGTSLACPMWAALFAVTNQGRALIGETPLDGRSQTLPLLYSISSGDYHDITSGNNGYSAGPGYDLVTGRGSPVPDSLINDLVNVPTLYVDPASPGPTLNGSSWADAYHTLQSALSAATGGERIDVSQGTYTPGTSRSSSFALVSGVDVYGGYAGYGTVNPNAENPVQYLTLLSGDIGAVGNNSDNTFHVVTATSVSAGTVLADFTIAYGNANGASPSNDGGGLYVSIGGPTVINCIFFDNTASADGGGAYISGTSTNRNAGSGLFLGCVFAINSASLGAADFGFDSNQTFTNCTFTANASNSLGYAIEQDALTATLVNCILWADTGSSGAEINSTGFGVAVNVTYSDIQGGFTGTGNINSNPLFLQAPGSGNAGNLQLGSASPVIDEGNNAGVLPFLITDTAGNTRIVNYPHAGATAATVDMGAYEAQIPLVLSATLVTPVAQQFTFQFSQNVSSSLTASNLTLTTLAGGPFSPPATLSYNSVTNTATFTLMSALPAGIYQADLSASGAHLTSDYIFNVLFMPAGSSLALSGQQIYAVQQFYFDPSASLDIGTNSLVIPYTSSSPAITIASLITSAYNDSAWNGPGITSSDISTGLAVASFDSGSVVTIRLTYDGDADLDGTVDSDDLSLIALGQATNGTRWQDGNFNYDAQVNADDWILLSLGAAISNGQPINSAAITSGTLPAATLPAASPTATPATISAASIFSNITAVLNSDPSDVLMA